ncbi:HAT domain-containing protein, partial [Macrophomina phaseolina MS6]
MDVLHKHYIQAFDKYRENHPLRRCIAASWAVFDKYYQLTDSTPAYGAAMILHPSRRAAHIKKNWPVAWHKPVLEGIKKYWEDQYQGLPVLTTTTPVLIDNLHPPDEYECIARELDVVGPAMNDLDEYKSFTTQTPIAVDCSPLAWWLREEQRQRYPRLSKMAIDILSIPAMSAEPERVFSGARRTTSWDRCQLGSHTVERGECMKSWIKSGITQDIPVDLAEEQHEDGRATAVLRASTPGILQEEG